MIFQIPDGTDINIVKEWLIENIGPLYNGKDIGEGWNIWSEIGWMGGILDLKMINYVNIDGRKCRSGGLTAFKLKFGQ
jgi:hypothetical protein